MLNRYFVIWALTFFCSISAFGSCAELLLDLRKPVVIQASVMDREQAHGRFGADLDPDARSFLWVEVSKPEASPIEFLDLVVRTNSEDLVRQSFPIDEGTLGQLLGLSMSKDAILALNVDRQIVPKGDRLEVSIDLKEVSPIPPPVPSPVSGSSANYASSGRSHVIQPGYESYAHGQHPTHFERGKANFQSRTGLSSHFYR